MGAVPYPTRILVCPLVSGQPVISPGNGLVDELEAQPRLRDVSMDVKL